MFRKTAIVAAFASVALISAANAAPSHRWFECQYGWQMGPCITGGTNGPNAAYRSNREDRQTPPATFVLAVHPEGSSSISAGGGAGGGGGGGGGGGR
ncbi:MAG: hypothetical protein KGM42_05995 [Hyphomicrobiales bacterium]|nr:hypothetical protein [Hyphomicrobiales bacterium]